MYAESPHNLILAVGDDGAERIMFTKESMVEDYRIDLERTLPEKDLLQQANELMLQLLQAQMLDTDTVSKMLNLAVPDEVYSASRRYLKKKQEILRQQAQMEQQQMEEANIAAQENDLFQKNLVLDQMEQAQMNQELNRDAKLMGDLLKSGNRQQQQVPNQVM